MGNRDRDRGPRSIVYFPPGWRKGGRHDQRRSYEKFVFSGREERVFLDGERRDRRAEESKDRDARQNRNNHFRRRGAAENRERNVGGNSRRGAMDNRYDRRRDTFDDRRRSAELFECCDRNEKQNGNVQISPENTPVVLPEYGYPAIAVMPGFVPTYTGGVYPVYAPYEGLMTEEEYKEFLEAEEFEDRYGRDFDRYTGDGGLLENKSDGKRSPVLEDDFDE